jgi:hypothetical protein
MMEEPLADINKPHDQLKIGNPLQQNECKRHQILCNHMIDAIYSYHIFFSFVHYNEKN